MSAAAFLHRAEFGALLGLAAFLPAVEAPKNICLALFLIFWLANRILKGDWGWRWSRWDSLVAALIASGYLAAVFGGLQVHAWSNGNDILVYGLVFMALRRTQLEKRQYWWLLGTLVVATLLTLGHGYWGLLVTQERKTLGLHSVGHVNHSAVYIGIAFSIAFVAACVVRSTVAARGALWGAAAVLLVSLLVTAARGALIPATIFVLVWIFRWQVQQGINPWKFVLAVAALAAVGLVVHPEIVQKTIYNVAEGHAGSYRPSMARTAIVAAREFPLFGVGLGQFGKITPELAQQWQAERGQLFADSDLYFSSHAHGLFSNTLAERGLVGLAILLGFLGATGLMLKGTAPQGGDETLAHVLWGSALGAWIMTVVGGVFNTTLHHENAMISSLLLASWLSYRDLGRSD